MPLTSYDNFYISPLDVFCFIHHYYRKGTWIYFSNMIPCFKIAMERFNFKMKQLICVGVAILILLFVVIGVKNAKLFYTFFIVKEMASEERINEITQELVSPDGKYVAYVFMNSGGATTGWFYHLSVLKNGQPLDHDSGNTYTSYPQFSIKWTGENSLQVINNHPETIFKQETQVDGVQIEYTFLDEDN